MQKYVGIVRKKDELHQAIKELLRIKRDAYQVKAHAIAQYNPGWNEAIDLENLLITAEAVTRSALMREESRGAHTRVDFENERDEWLKVNLIVRKSHDGTMVVEKVKREEPSKDLNYIAHASLEELEGSDG